MAESKKDKPLIELLQQRFEDYSYQDLYSMIMCGEIKVGGETIREARKKVDPDSDIVIKSRRWVSRGGGKLEHALLSWNISSESRIVLDAGASTGGFTDCLLKRGASEVHSVDVGYNQLDYSLRIDKRVHVHERTNIMSVNSLTPQPDFAVADLSFRSITGAASHILKLTKNNLLIALIKPQFELSDTYGFDGVIRDENLLLEVVKSVALTLQDEGVIIDDLIKSPIKGTKGNTEFLFLLHLADEEEIFSNIDKIESFSSKI